MKSKDIEETRLLRLKKAKEVLDVLLLDSLSSFEYRDWKESTIQALKSDRELIYTKVSLQQEWHGFKELSLWQYAVYMMTSHFKCRWFDELVTLIPNRLRQTAIEQLKEVIPTRKEKFEFANEDKRVVIILERGDDEKYTVYFKLNFNSAMDFEKLIVEISNLERQFSEFITRLGNIGSPIQLEEFNYTYSGAIGIGEFPTVAYSLTFQNEHEKNDFLNVCTSFILQGMQYIINPSDLGFAPSHPVFAYWRMPKNTIAVEDVETPYNYKVGEKLELSVGIDLNVLLEHEKALSGIIQLPCELFSWQPYLMYVKEDNGGIEYNLQVTYGSSQLSDYVRLSDSFIDAFAESGIRHFTMSHFLGYTDRFLNMQEAVAKLYGCSHGVDFSQQFCKLIQKSQISYLKFGDIICLNDEIVSAIASSKSLQYVYIWCSNMDRETLDRLCEIMLRADHLIDIQFEYKLQDDLQQVFNAALNQNQERLAIARSQSQALVSQSSSVRAVIAAGGSPLHSSVDQQPDLPEQNLNDKVLRTLSNINFDVKVQELESLVLNNKAQIIARDLLTRALKTAKDEWVRNPEDDRKFVGTCRQALTEALNSDLQDHAPANCIIGSICDAINWIASIFRSTPLIQTTSVQKVLTFKQVITKNDFLTEEEPDEDPEHGLI